MNGWNKPIPPPGILHAPHISVPRHQTRNRDGNWIATQGAPPVWIDFDAPSSKEAKEISIWNCMRHYKESGKADGIT